MNFNSVQFMVFLPLVLLVYGRVLARERRRDVFLLVASYVFYMSWDWRYAGLILFSTLVDFVVGARMYTASGTARRRTLLIISLVVNLGVLGVFKYFNFFMDTAQGLFALMGLSTVELPHARLLLPVGISFYTFQSLSYTIDIYREGMKPERSFVKFALFVAFFPQLVAGPIVRASHFLPQLHRDPDVTRSRTQRGAARMFRGLFKKVVIADLLAGLGVDAVFADPSGYSSLTLLLALYGYAFQIYNDFSGYSDIAIGVAMMLGFDIPENFNRPYLARNPREFWSRWHISLSTWLRDYLYIPLGGNRGSNRKTIRNLMITMILGGLWHGAALNFVFWGLWHGLLLVAFRSARKSAEGLSRGRIIVERFFCFHLITVSWLLFRIGGVGDLAAYLRGLFSLTGGLALSPLYVAILALAALFHFVPSEWVGRRFDRFAQLPVPVQGMVYAGFVFLFVGLSLGTPAFIYFQF